MVSLNQSIYWYLYRPSLPHSLSFLQDIHNNLNYKLDNSQQPKYCQIFAIYFQFLSIQSTSALGGFFSPPPPLYVLLPTTSRLIISDFIHLSIIIIIITIIIIIFISFFLSLNHPKSKNTIEGANVFLAYKHTFISASLLFLLHFDEHFSFFALSRKVLFFQLEKKRWEIYQL